MLDNGIGGEVAPRVVAWDTREVALHRILHLPAPVTVESRFVNDLAVDRRHGQVIIADTAGESPALIVVDIETGLARRVLANHQTMQAEDVDMVVEAAVVAPTGEPARIPVNPITIDAESTWVYYGAMNGTALHRIPTAAPGRPGPGRCGAGGNDRALRRQAGLGRHHHGRRRQRLHHRSRRRRYRRGAAGRKL